MVDTATGADAAPGQRGELLVRTPAAMLGYLNNPQATAATIDADRWVHTGDIATVDERGWFRVVDRLKELIKYKGYQVAPAELEGILLASPCVADCAVIGSPDLEAGEVPKAFVVLRPGCTSDGLLDWVAQRVAPYQKIRCLEVVDQIPKSASGKILHRILHEADGPPGARPRPEHGHDRDADGGAAPHPGRPQAGLRGGAGEPREPGTGPADRRDPRGPAPRSGWWPAPPGRSRRPWTRCSRAAAPRSR